MEKVSSARIALKWGLIYGIISILFTTVTYNTELWKNWVIGLLFGVVLVIGILYAANQEFISLNGGYMSFKEGLGLGTLTVTTGGILGLAYDMVYKKFIDTNLVHTQMEMAREQYENMGMSEEQIDAALVKAESYASSGLAFIFGLIFVVFIGFICALIMSAIMKKEKPVFS